MDYDQDTPLPGLIEIAEERLPTVTQPGRAEIRRQATDDKGPLLIDPSLCDIWPANTRDVAAVVREANNDLKFAIEKIGQQVAVIARISPHDPERFKVIAGARRLTVVRQINEELEG